MCAIHGGKAKNDKINSHKIAVLLRGGSFPLDYVYPKELRTTQYNLPPLGRITKPGGQDGLLENFSDPMARHIVEVDLLTIKHY